MHISMCIKNIVRGSAAPLDHCLVLLDRVMSTCAERRGSSSIAKAIHQALPGVHSAESALLLWLHDLGLPAA